MPHHRRDLLTLCLACAAMPSMAGTPQVSPPPGLVQVTFEGDLQRYADLGEDAVDREQAVADLTAIFVGLKSLLPEGLSLGVVVTDVNLAGELEWTRSGKRIRVMRDIGWPIIELRYELKRGQTVLKAGRERLSDMAYLNSPPMGVGSGRVAHEERMLQRWARALVGGL